MHVDASMTLGGIAARHPESMPVFDRLGLDYCCGGRTTLEEAAAAKGLLLQRVIDLLEESDQPDDAAAERDWTSASMTELADHIETTHHAFVRDALSRLESLSERVVAAHGVSRPHLNQLRDVINEFADDMHDHMVREERVLFPWLRRLERPTEIQSGPPWSVRRPIDCMMHDHDDAAAAFTRMRELTSNFEAPDDACPTLRSLYATLDALEQDTHRHIHKENNILFPAGIAAESEVASR